MKKKMREGNSPLEDLFDLSFGLKTGDDSKFLSRTRDGAEYKPLLRGEDVHRYRLAFKGEYVRYDPGAMRAHRTTARPGSAERFEQPKVLVRDTRSGLQGTFDQDHYYTKDVLIVSDQDKSADKLRVLTGVLNSRLMRFYYETSFPTLHVQRDELASLPIHAIDFSNADDKRRYSQIVEMVIQMLSTQQQRLEIERGWRDWVAAVVPNQHNLTEEFLDQGWVETGFESGWEGVKAELQARNAIPGSKDLQKLRRETEEALGKLRPLYERIRKTNELIDQIVYRLYGLTEDEIAVVEASVGRS